MTSNYEPIPADTSGVVIGNELDALAESLAENVHDIWAAERIRQGWRYGSVRDDARKMHPCLVPYADLPEYEKQFDRRTAIETLKFAILNGYEITKTSKKEKYK